jgi:hypothetical protein
VKEGRWCYRQVDHTCNNECLKIVLNVLLYLTEKLTSQSLNISVLPHSMGQNTFSPFKVTKFSPVVILLDFKAVQKSCSSLSLFSLSLYVVSDSFIFYSYFFCMLVLVLQHGSLVYVGKLREDLSTSEILVLE